MSRYNVAVFQIVILESGSGSSFQKNRNPDPEADISKNQNLDPWAQKNHNPKSGSRPKTQKNLPK